MAGDVRRTVTYAWMDGGGGRIQYINFQQQGRPLTQGMEMIGQFQRYGEEPSMDIHARSSSSPGETLDDVEDVDGDTLTIWFGARGFPAYDHGTFSSDGATLTGVWQYPGGGGSTAHATRIP